MPITGDTNDKEFSFNANHKLSLWRGSFGANYGWSDFSGDNNGSTVSGGNQVLSATAGFAPTDRFTTQFQFNYDSSLSGAVEQQLIGLGGIAPDVNLGNHSYSISMSNSDNLVLTKSLSVGFNVGHIQQEVYGESVSATHFSAIANYRFLKPLWGTVVIYAGVNDQATDAGNLGAGLVAGVNFNKQWSNFLLSGSFGYSQDTQTVLATEVTSSYSYLANAQRRLTRRLRWMATFNGFHTGLGELPVRTRIPNRTEPNWCTKCTTREPPLSYVGCGASDGERIGGAAGYHFANSHGQRVPAGHRVILFRELYGKSDAQAAVRHQLHQDDQ